MRDDFSGEAPDIERLDEMLEPSKLPAAEIIADDSGRPKGPDYVELRTVIIASKARANKLRRRWREKNADRLPEDRKQKLLEGEGRIKVATPETQKAYLARARGLIKRYKWETDTPISDEDLDPRLFVNFLLGLKPTLTKNTWRQYRASSATLIATMPSVHVEEALAMLQADHQVGDDEGNRGKREVDAHGASLRAKRFEYHHFQHLKRSLRVVSRSQAVDWLRDWLDAGINTGLRPMEWELTMLERRPDRRCLHGQHIWLHVVNAKAADGRGAHRTLDISSFSLETLRAVERMVKRSRDWALAGRTVGRQSEVSRLLRDTCQVLFPRMTMHYTLYSLRHQFIANMKTLYSRAEVAAMVGHISVDTQVEHYGKRRASWLSHEIFERPCPVEEQVAHITKRLELFEQRRALIALKEAAATGAPGDPINEGFYEPGDEHNLD